MDENLEENQEESLETEPEQAPKAQEPPEPELEPAEEVEATEEIKAEEETETEPEPTLEPEEEAETEEEPALEAEPEAEELEPASVDESTPPPVKAAPEPEIPVFETVERPVEDEDEDSSQTIGLLMDVQLDLSVLLGSCELTLEKVLNLTKGSIIELDTTTSNPIDLLANSKVIAQGEVVIIEDNFGLRITNMVEEKK
jgi:flagellar motor switch protein FliN/FliY